MVDGSCKWSPVVLITFWTPLFPSVDLLNLYIVLSRKHNPRNTFIIFNIWATIKSIYSIFFFLEREVLFNWTRISYFRSRTSWYESYELILGGLFRIIRQSILLTSYQSNIASECRRKIFEKFTHKAMKIRKLAVLVSVFQSGRLSPQCIKKRTKTI